MGIYDHVRYVCLGRDRRNPQRHAASRGETIPTPSRAPLKDYFYSEALACGVAVIWEMVPGRSRRPLGG